jgi:malate synthase
MSKMKAPNQLSQTEPSKAAAIVVRGAMKPGFDEILTPDALAFVADLVRTFRPRVRELLAARVARQARIDANGAAGELELLAETKSIREGDWTCAPEPEGILDRRVEITGPVDRKMVINALNSGANVFMADFEDANSPTWENVVQGQINLRDANRRTIRLEPSAPGGKTYVLNDKIATLFVRPRGWHLVERHILVDGDVVPGSLVDFGLYAFHNARVLAEKNAGPYFYLPKLESHLEARLWNDVFLKAQVALGIPKGTFKATVLIETLPAAFEMDEILYELRDHSAGLNCGRWDYIFSFIKKRRKDAAAVLPDRAEVTMDKGFLRAYSERLIAVCHKRGVHAMGGMAAQIPIKDDAEANERALAKVRADKLREVSMGHDGTWVAHPGLVPIAREIFDAHMTGKNQLAKKTSSSVGQKELLAVPEGNRTEAGLRHNIRVGIQYIAAWLRGQGCVPLYHLMEDAATAEISRAQVWQWVAHGAPVTRTDGSSRPVTHDELARIVNEESRPFSDGEQLNAAKDLFLRLVSAPEFEEFLTLPAYEKIADV